MDQSIDLDLDTLLDEPVKVKINGQVILVYPPTVQDIFSLTSFMKRFREVNSGQSDEDVEKLMTDFKEVFTKIIPQLENHKMTIKQLFKLLQFVMSLASPQETGPKVEYIGQEKKVLSQESSLQSSPDSFTSTQDIQPQAS